MDREPLQHGKKGGRFRQVFLVGPGKDHVAKKQREMVRKKYPFGTVHYPSAVYGLLKFGNTNINKADYQNYLALPPEVRAQFAPKSRLLKGVMVQEQVMDYDGSRSLSVDEHVERSGKIRNEHFWSDVDKLKEMLLDDESFLFGVFSGGANVLVQKKSPDVWRPMIVDFKRLGRRSFPFQVSLALKRNLKMKFDRHFERFTRRYKESGDSGDDGKHLSSNTDSA